MHLLFILAPIFLVIALVRLITLPFRIARRQRYGNYYGGGCGNGFGYNGYGRRHRHGFGGIGTLLAIFAIERIFGGRRF